MNRFRVDSLTFTLPESWAEVTLDQFLTLTDADAPDTSAFRLTTLSGLPEGAFRPLAAPDLDRIVGQYTAYLFETPDLPAQKPAAITINGKTVALPADLGSSATVGQMWDIEFVIKSRQKEELPVDSAALAPLLLSVFLWPLLTDQPYTDRHQAEIRWPEIGTVNCIDGLVVSAFFLHSFLNPSPSGRISVTLILPMPTSSWPHRLRVAFRRLILTLRPSS